MARAGGSPVTSVTRRPAAPFALCGRSERRLRRSFAALGITGLISGPACRLLSADQIIQGSLATIVEETPAPPSTRPELPIAAPLGAKRRRSRPGMLQAPIAATVVGGLFLDSISTLTSLAVVLVVAAPPHAGLVAPLGGAVEPLVHAPESVQSAGIGGVG